MAKFCKFCGTPLEEGQVCTCAGSQATQAPEAPVATAPAAEAKASLFAEWKNSLLQCLKTPKAAAADVLGKPTMLPQAGLYAGLHAIVIFVFIWALLGMILGAMPSGLEITYPIFPMLVTGVGLSAIFIGLSGVALFAVAKIMKRELSIQQGVAVAAVGATYPSALLLIALILSFVSVEAMLIAILATFLVWIVNACCDLREFAGLDANASLKEMIIALLVIVVVGYASILLMGKLLPWCIGELAINGMKMSDAMGAIGDITDILGGLMG